MGAFGLLVLFAFAAIAAAAPVCAPANFSSPFYYMCQPYVSGLVYVDDAVPNAPDNQTSNLFGMMYVLRRMGSFGRTRQGASFACMDLLIRNLCLRQYPPCTTVNTASGQAAMFSNPCSSACTDLYASTYVQRGANASLPTSCTGRAFSILTTNSSDPVTGNLGLSVSQANEILVPCQATWPASTPFIGGQPKYGPLTWNFDAQTQVVASCSLPPLVPQNASTFPCYETYYFNPLGDPDGGYCARLCPAPLHRDRAQLLSVLITAEVLCWFGFLLSLATLVLRFTVPKYCRYPTTLVQLLLFGCMMFSFVGLLVTFSGGPFRVACEWTNDGGQQSQSGIGTFNTYRWPTCAATFLLQRLGLLITWFSWAAIAVTSATTVLFRRDISTLWSAVLTVLIILLLPFPLTFSEAYGSGQNIQGSAMGLNPSPCIIATPALFTGVSPWVQFVSYVAPMCVCILIGGAGIIYVLISMLRVTDMNSSFHVLQNLRLLSFMGWMLLFAAITLAAYIHQYVFTDPTYNLPSATAAILPWTICLQYRDAAICNRTYTFWFINFGLWTTSTLLYPLTAIFLSCLFAFQKDLWSNWGERIMPWTGLVNSVKSLKPGGGGSATSTTAGSSTSSGSSSGSDGGSTLMSDLS